MNKRQRKKKSKRFVHFLKLAAAYSAYAAMLSEIEIMVHGILDEIYFSRKHNTPIS